MHLKWDRPLEDISYDPLLVTISDGLRETDHPYVVIVQKGFWEMCAAEGAREKVIPLLRKIVANLRMALQSPNAVIFENGLNAIDSLTLCVGDAIEPHLSLILVQISKKSFDKKYANRITEVLQSIDRNCDNDEVTKLIKSKVPTYQSVRY